MFLLEGNMGAGKSTMLALIQKHLPHLEVVFEPVDAWSAEGTGKPLLSNFYKDQKRWAYTMEKYTLLTRVQEYLKEQAKSDFKIMERSIYSGYYCFAKNGLIQGNLEPSEWEAYNLWFEFLIGQRCKTPSGFIYLYSTPEVCRKRMQKRNRTGEEGVPLTYLEQLHDRHEEFLNQQIEIHSKLKAVPILKLDVTEKFSENPAIFKLHLDKIASFIGGPHTPPINPAQASI